MKRLLFLTILFFVIVSWAFILLDLDPPAWDEAMYLSQSLRLYRSIVSGNIADFMRSYSNAIITKAPLISVLPLPFYLILQTSYYSAMLVNIVLMVLLSIYIYFVTKYFDQDNKWSALFAVCIINTMPVVHEWSRIFMTEYALGVFALIWVYYLIKSDSFTNKSICVNLGIWLGLGLLIKSIFPIYILGAIIFIFVVNIRNLDKIKIAGLHLFYIIIIGLSIAGTWYMFNLIPMFEYALRLSILEKSHWYGLGGKGIFLNIYLYLKHIIFNGISLYYSILFIFCLVVYFFKTKNILRRKGLILSWIVAPTIFLLLTPNKGLQFTLPVLVPLAVLLSIMLNDILKKWSTLAIILPLAAFVVYPFSNVMFARNIFRPPKINMTFSHPTERIVEFIASRTGSSHMVACVVDEDFYNNFSFNYFSNLHRSPCRFFETFYLERFNEAVSLINTADFCIVKTGNLGPWFSNVHNYKLRDLIMAHPDIFVELVRMQTLDRQEIIIYKRVNTLPALNVAMQSQDKTK